MAYPYQAGVGVIPAQSVTPWYFDGIKLVAAAAANVLFCATVTLAANTWTSIVTPLSGMRLYLLHVLVSAEAATIFRLRPTGGTAWYFDVMLAANSPASFDYRPTGYNVGNRGDGIDAFSSVATNIHVNILYQSAPVVV